VRRFRKIITILALALLLTVALLTGALAASVYSAFGSDKSIDAQGPAINAQELQSCGVVLIDVDRIEIRRPSQLALLPNPREKLKVTLSPEVTFNAGVLSRESVDKKILGFDTCIATLESDTWKVTHTALGQPWFPFGEEMGFVAGGTGTSVSFDVTQATEGTLIIETPNQELKIQQIELDAELGYPQADTWVVGLVISSGFLIVLFIALVVVYIIYANKRPRA
jgi:hypothetical protein